MSAREFPKPVTILVVDDDEEDVELLADMLESRGYANPLEVALSVDEALALLQSRGADFGIVLVDLHMPRRSGFDLLASLAELRQSGREVASRVFVLTSSPRAEDRERALALGAAGYLTKPLTDESVHFMARSGRPLRILLCE